MTAALRKLRAACSRRRRRDRRRRRRSSASRPANDRSPTACSPTATAAAMATTCLNSNGALIDMRAMDRILGFDADRPASSKRKPARCFPTSSRMPRRYGFFPQVVPGTQFVTLGGAIANDVHGKNHHRRGTFGRHVEAFTLLRSDGSLHHCTPTRDARLFEATIGGMGLTGVILSASIRLMRVRFARHRRAGDAVPRPRRVLRPDRRGRRRTMNMSSPGSTSWRRASAPAAAC